MAIITEPDFRRLATFMQDTKLENLVYACFCYIDFLWEQKETIPNKELGSSVNRNIILYLGSICEAILRCIIIELLQYGTTEQKRKIGSMFQELGNVSSLEVLNIDNANLEFKLSKKVSINQIFREKITFSAMIDVLLKINISWMDCTMLKSIKKMAEDRNTIHIHKLYEIDVEQFYFTNEVVQEYLLATVKLLKQAGKMITPMQN